MKKAVSIILVLVLLCTSVLSFAAAEARASNYFSSYGTSISPVGGGKIYITFRAVGTGLCNQLGVANYTVQRRDDDGDWVDVSGLLSGQTGTNVAAYSFGRYFQGVAGETYRVRVTFYCLIRSGSEFKSYTSGRVTAK